MQFKLIVPKLLVKGKGKTETLSEVAEWQHIQHMNIFPQFCAACEVRRTKMFMLTLILPQVNPVFFSPGSQLCGKSGWLATLPHSHLQSLHFRENLPQHFTFVRSPVSSHSKNTHIDMKPWLVNKDPYRSIFTIPVRYQYIWLQS